MRGALADAAAANHIARPMRKDMAKVIVERPRLGRAAAGLRPGRMRPLVDDDGEIVRAKGAREPVARAQKTKGLNETLNPLRRYLESQVGRPWNKVYSEISAHLKPTSTVQQHVRDHIEDFVAFRTRMREGQVYVNDRWGQSYWRRAGSASTCIHAPACCAAMKSAPRADAWREICANLPPPNALRASARSTRKRRRTFSATIGGK